MVSGRWVRLFCLLWCLALVAPCVAASGETTKVAAYLLRLREQPSERSKVLDAYPRGTRVTILKKGDTWTKVQVHGKEGYMKTDLLAYGRNNSSGTETKASAKNDSKAGSVSEGATAYVVKGTWLNLRESYNGGDIIGCYRGGTKVTILKKGRHWSFVEVKGQQGYMHNDYLTSNP